MPKGSSASRAARATGSASLDANRRGSARVARFAVRSTSSCSGRTSVATRGGTHGSSSSPSTLGVPTVATGDVHAHHERRARAAGCARRDPPPHVARRLRARTARQPRVASCSRRPRCSSGCRATAALRTREVADRCRVRPDAGARLPLSGLLRRRRPGRRAAAARSATGRSPTATRTRTATSEARASGSTTSCS